mmetsp:Transcript_19970/g.59328  ORF Transcript_19970/g.59328 Transcript_19970/m.59328 type:complete len:238 (+) Transcript_19970:348-1061(+)
MLQHFPEASHSRSAAMAQRRPCCGIVPDGERWCAIESGHASQACRRCWERDVPADAGVRGGVCCGPPVAPAVHASAVSAQPRPSVVAVFDTPVLPWQPRAPFVKPVPAVRVWSFCGGDGGHGGRHLHLPRHGARCCLRQRVHAAQRRQRRRKRRHFWPLCDVGAAAADAAGRARHQGAAGSGGAWQLCRAAGDRRDEAPREGRPYDAGHAGRAHCAPRRRSGRRAARAAADASASRR